MKFIYLTIILLLTFSCSNEKDITEFEKILGKENSETLTYLVNDFESNFLKRQYPNLDTKKAYKQFLTELSKGETEYWNNFSKSSREYLKDSNLRLEIYSVPDSIWIERDPEKLTLSFSDVPMLKIKRKYLMPDGTFGYSTLLYAGFYIPYIFCLCLNALFPPSRISQLISRVSFLSIEPSESM